MFKLVVKLNGFKPEISRTVYVREDISFSHLDSILRKVFGFSYFHLSIFEFPGLNAPLWDFDKTYPDCRAMDMNEIPVKDYFGLFKKFSWTYNLMKSYTFTVSIRKTNRKYDTDYPFVESFNGDYNPIEDVSIYDFEEMLYCTLNSIEFPDYLPDFEMEEFNINEVNEILKEF